MAAEIHPTATVYPGTVLGDGVRVLDLTRVLAGPTSGRVLAENGADVLHIAAPHLPYQTELLMDTGHGKRCAWVDLAAPSGIETRYGLSQAWNSRSRLCDSSTRNA